MAAAVSARWKQLGYRSVAEMTRASGLSRPQMDKVVRGERRRYQDVTIESVARALQWQADWYERLLAGKMPLPLDGAAPLMSPERLNERIDSLDRRITETADLLEQTRLQVDRLLDELLPRRDGPGRR